MKLLFGFLLPKKLDNTDEQLGNYKKNIWQHCIYGFALLYQLVQSCGKGSPEIETHLSTTS